MSAPSPQRVPRSSRRAAVIGSGFGGLAAAIRLQAAGFETTIFEARDKPGGRAYVYEEKGYTFDAGPTVITAPHCLEELYQACGERLDEHVELLPVHPLYRLHWDDGDSFNYTGDPETMREQIRKQYPGDEAGYTKFADYASKVFKAGYEDLAHTPFLKFWDMVRVSPQLAKLRADRSVYDVVKRFVKNDHLRQALSFHSLLVGGNPYETSSIYTLIHHLERKWGVYFPRGGTGALIRALVSLFQSKGGSLRLSSPVQSVTLEGTNGSTIHQITSATGEAEPFDLVVSNADLHHTYSKLYGKVPEASGMRKKLSGMDWSMSLFVLYFGTDRPYTEDVAHHTVVFGPRYKGLLDEIFHGAKLPDDFSLYLHAPTVTDPSLAPPGGGTFYVLAPVPHLGNADVDWDAIAPGYADRILESLETYLPDLRKHTVVRRWMTPNTFRDELNSQHGSAFSVAPKLTQSAWFRPHNRDPKVPGLYLVGAGTHPGAGVPGVINSAKATTSLVLDDWGMR